MNRRDMPRTFHPPAGAAPVPGTPPGVEPFRVEFGEDRVRELHGRIERASWPEVPFETGWSEGMDDRVLRELVGYWRDGYDWLRVQDELNRMPHYSVAVGGERLHFVWYRGSGERQPFPLLLLHGWPSSFLEFAEAVPLLLEGSGGRPGFDLVVPSLPGFALSAASAEAGTHPGRIAERVHRLMGELGYRRYGVDGNDWGLIVADELARGYPDAVVGLHRLGGPGWGEPQGREATPEERAFLDEKKRFWAEEVAYFHLHGTKPQAIAYALQDSPVGLAAWFLEKWWSWIDHDGDLWSVVGRDTFLTTVMLYWLTGRVLSSSRVYYENRVWPESEKTAGPVAVPTWFAGFPGDPFTSGLRSLAVSGRYRNIVHVGEQPRGGHFAAMEQPAAWAGSVAAFFSGLSPGGSGAGG